MPQQPSDSTPTAVPDAPALLTEITDRIGIVTLNRPARRNALNGELMAALDGAVKAMAADDGVKVVILTGAAPPAASSGCRRTRWTVTCPGTTCTRPCCCT